MKNTVTNKLQRSLHGSSIATERYRERERKRGTERDTEIQRYRDTETQKQTEIKREDFMITYK